MVYIYVLVFVKVLVVALQVVVCLVSLILLCFSGGLYTYYVVHLLVYWLESWGFFSSLFGIVD